MNGPRSAPDQMVTASSHHGGDGIVCRASQQSRQAAIAGLHPAIAGTSPNAFSADAVDQPLQPAFSSRCIAISKRIDVDVIRKRVDGKTQVVHLLSAIGCLFRDQHFCLSGWVLSHHSMDQVDRGIVAGFNNE